MTERSQPNSACDHDWKIWPETDGKEQRCMKCGAYRATPRCSPDSDILPCPFCGSDDLTLTTDRYGWKVVQCDDCGTSGPCIDLEDDEYIDRWNKRAPAQGAQVIGVDREAVAEAHEHLKKGIEAIKMREVGGYVPLQLNQAAHALHHALNDDAAPQAALIRSNETPFTRQFKKDCQALQEKLYARDVPQAATDRYWLITTLDALEAIDSEIALTGHLKELVDHALSARSLAQPVALPQAARETRTGVHALQMAKSLGWPDDGEGALEFMLRRAREVAFEDCAQPQAAREQLKPFDVGYIDGIILAGILDDWCNGTYDDDTKASAERLSRELAERIAASLTRPERDGFGNRLCPKCKLPHSIMSGCPTSAISSQEQAPVKTDRVGGVK